MDADVKGLLHDLIQGNKVSRLKAVTALAYLETSTEEIVRALEQAVLTDPDPQVQESALAALALPIHQRIHRLLNLPFITRPVRQSLLVYIDDWAANGLLTPQAAALLRRRCALDALPAPSPKPKPAPVPPSLPEFNAPAPAKPAPAPPPVAPAPKKPEAAMPLPASVSTPLPSKKTPPRSYDGELALESLDVEVIEPALLEKQKFSLIGTLTSEMTIKIVLYLGAFLIVAAAIIFAGLVEPVRFPMLTVALVGFLTASSMTIQRLPLGSFVLFVIGTLLIPIDAAVFAALLNMDTSMLYWAGITAGMSVVWGWGTYVYRSRFFSFMLYVTFSLAVYLTAAFYLPLTTHSFLPIFGLVAMAGLGEVVFLRRWQGENFSIPMFAIVQVQALGVLAALGIDLATKLVGVFVPLIVDGVSAFEGSRTSVELDLGIDLSTFNGQDMALLATWFILGAFYFASDSLTRRVKQFGLPAFRLLVTACLMPLPLFIMEAISASPYQIAAVMWLWGAGLMIAAEGLEFAPVYWRRTYDALFLYAAFFFLLAAPLAAYVITPQNAIGFLLATSAVFLLMAYRRRNANFWSVGLSLAYLAYLVGVQVQNEGASDVFIGYALLIPALFFLTVELGVRQYFRAAPEWAGMPLILGIFNTIWVVSILLSWYTDHPRDAALIYFIFALFGTVYAVLSARDERGYARAAWSAGVIAFYAAYLNLVPNVNDMQFAGYILLAPAMLFLSAAVIGKNYFQLASFWILPLLGMGFFNVVLDILAALAGGLGDYPGSAALIFLIYGVLGVLYAVYDKSSERLIVISVWTAGLVALYAAYGFTYRLLAMEGQDIFPGYVLLLPALVFLSAELIGRLYLRASQDWTLPLLGFGVLNAALVVAVMVNTSLEDIPPGSAVIVALIYGVFGVFYARQSAVERDYALPAWVVGLIALYVAYGFVYRLPAIERLDIFPGYALLLPAIVFLSAELIGRLYLRASQDWTLPLLGFGFLNAALVVPLIFNGGVNEAPGSAAVTALIYGVFGVFYARQNAPSQRIYALPAWIVGLIALYAAYGFVYRLPDVENLDIFPGYALLLPAIVFLSAELIGRLYLRASQDWTLPLLGFGLLNAVLVVPVIVTRGLTEAPDSAAIAALIYGLFGIFYARLSAPSHRDYAIPAWAAGMIALYVAYGFAYQLPAIDKLDIFPGYALLLPALVFLSAELVSGLYLRVSEAWTLPLLGLGVLNAALVVPVTLVGGLNGAVGSAAITALIYGLFGVFYALVSARSGGSYPTVAWTVGLIALYAAYGFFCFLPNMQGLDISPAYGLLLPALVFLTAELIWRLYLRASEAWTLPLLYLGTFNIMLGVPLTLILSEDNYLNSSIIIFVIYGLFGVLYARLSVQSERQYAIIAWAASLIALYIAYFLAYQLPAIERLEIFPGYRVLLPALVFLSAELMSRLYLRLSQAWTLPLLGLGLLNAALVVPITLTLGLEDASGSAAIIFLIYGLFIALYVVLDKQRDLGYLATGSLTTALGFALLFYDQERWVIPFAALATLFYLGGVAVNALYDQRDWSRVLHWSGLALGTATALSAPSQGGGDAAVGMGVVATIYGAEAFITRNIWFGLPANGLFLAAYFMALQELKVTEPQFYSIGTGLLAIVTHYLLNRRTEGRAAFMIGFATGVISQVILLGTSFIQMTNELQQGAWQFFFILFFQSLILLGYGLVIRSLSFIIIPILFVVGGVLYVIFTALASYSAVITLGCTGFALVLLGVTALVMRERLLKTYQDFL